MRERISRPPSRQDRRTHVMETRDTSRVELRCIAIVSRRLFHNTINRTVRRHGMGTWLIDSPQRLTLDGDVGQLDVWFAQGKLRVVGTEGPARIEITKVGRKGINVTLEDGLLS